MGASLRERYVSVEDVRLHAVEAGEGPLVVLLHGFPDFWRSWRLQLDALAEAGFRAVAPDMRGYNLSGKPRRVSAYSTDRLGADVAALIRGLGEERAHVVGHDWGGGAAWMAAVRHPEVVDRLAILNTPHPVMMVRGLRTPSQLAKSWYMGFFQLPLLPEMALRAGRFRVLRRTLEAEPGNAFSAEEIEERYVEAWSRSGGMTGPLNFYRAAFRRNPLSVLRETTPVRAPTLIVWGLEDPFLGRELADPGPELVPDRRVERIAGAGHWVHRSKPDEVNRLLIDFFRGR